MFISHVLGFGNLRKDTNTCSWWRSFLWLYFHMTSLWWERETKLSHVSFHFSEAPQASWLYGLQIPPYWNLGFQHRNLRKAQSIHNDVQGKHHYFRHILEIILKLRDEYLTEMSRKTWFWTFKKSKLRHGGTCLWSQH